MVSHVYCNLTTLLELNPERQSTRSFNGRPNIFTKYCKFLVFIYIFRGKQRIVVKKFDIFNGILTFYIFRILVFSSLFLF